MSDAWEHHSLGGYDDCEYDPSDFEDCDELFYHTPYYKTKVVTKTSKATLLEDSTGQFWVPTKLIRYNSIGTLYIWENFEPSYLCNDIDSIEGEDI